MLKKKKRPASVTHPSGECRFHLAKAMVLANTNFKQRSGINSAASFLLDGHSVDLSEEFVEQKPSILRSSEWETDWTPPAPRSSSAGIIRVCWQCPEETNLNQIRSKVTE